MILEEWCVRNRTIPLVYPSIKDVVTVIDGPNREQLFKLSDYVVTSQCGGIIWLRRINASESRKVQ